MAITVSRLHGTDASETVKKLVPMFYQDNSHCECARIFAELISSASAEVILFSDERGPVFLFQYGYFRNMVNFVLRKDYRGQGKGREFFNYAVEICNLNFVETGHSQYAGHVKHKAVVDITNIDEYHDKLHIMAYAVWKNTVSFPTDYELSDYFDEITFVDGYQEKIEAGEYSSPEFDMTL